MTELEKFDQWWGESDDIPNDGPWAHDTPIQFAWAAWQARATAALPPALPQGVEEWIANNLYPMRLDSQLSGCTTIYAVNPDDLRAYLSGMAIVPKDHILLPTNTAEARAMALLGTEWLKNNAPHLLKNSDVPEGMAIVPVEPTEDMILAAIIAVTGRRMPFITDAEKVRAIWQAMLAAAKEQS